MYLLHSTKLILGKFDIWQLLSKSDSEKSRYYIIGWRYQHQKVVHGPHFEPFYFLPTCHSTKVSITQLDKSFATPTI